MLGYILAFISSIFFGLYVVPRKFTKQNPLYFSLFMTIGFFVGSLSLYSLKPILLFNESPNSSLLWSIVAGPVWSAGFVFFIKSIDLMGLARSNQWKNLQGPIGVLLSLIILGEYASTNPLFALLAGFSVFLSAIYFNIVPATKERKINAKGIYLATLSALAFGAVMVINKYVTTSVGVYSQQVVWSLSMVVSIIAYIFSNKELSTNLIKISKKDIYFGLLAGILYLGASFFMLQSYRYIPSSIGFTIIQLNAIWTVSIGLFLFKEINFKKYSKRITLGFICALVGIILLFFAKK